MLAYYEICTKSWDHHTAGNENQAHAPYANAGNLWVAYDDEESIRFKIEQLVNALGLNGITFWALDFDDFSGLCASGEKFPLLRSAKWAMKGDFLDFEEVHFCNPPLLWLMDSIVKIHLIAPIVSID